MSKQDDYIDSAIEYLQDLKRNKSAISRVRIDFEGRQAIPGDDNYDPNWSNWAKVDNFHMQIWGTMERT